ncbi:CDP-diacylglycerol--inositol 3-phosphatidyltransferase [Taenia solium]|eukprot:TsM_000784800 transcript=TsM_000784800 gene=TsM_000784800
MAGCIFIFVPNLIGYARILLLLYACWYMSTDPVRAVVSYLLSALLDAVDGHVARLLDQSTKFGAALDMLSDRCTTTCLLFTLGVFYPRYLFLFQMSACIDIASHWLHVQSSIQSGSSSHKTISLDGNPLLRVYYTNRVILFIMCAGNELFYTMLYLLHFIKGPTWIYLVILYLSLPIAFLKTLISLVHLYAAAVNMAGIDAFERERSQSQPVNPSQEKVNRRSKHRIFIFSELRYL